MSFFHFDMAFVQESKWSKSWILAFIAGDKLHVWWPGPSSYFEDNTGAISQKLYPASLTSTPRSLLLLLLLMPNSKYQISTPCLALPMTHDRTNAGNIEMWQILSLLWSIIKHQPLYNICTNLIKIKTNVTIFYLKVFVSRPDWKWSTTSLLCKILPPSLLIGHMPDQMQAREQCDKLKF